MNLKAFFTRVGLAAVAFGFLASASAWAQENRPQPDEKPNAVRLIKDEGYARLSQAGFEMREGEEYRFSCRVRGKVRFNKFDQVPEFWPDNTGAVKKIKNEKYVERNGWTVYECVVTVPKDGTYELNLAIWNLKTVEFTDVSLKTEDGREMVKNGQFRDELDNWRAFGGQIEHSPGSENP